MPDAIRRIALVLLLAVGTGSAGVGAQDSKSQVAATRLGQVLDRLKLDSIAAPDPEAPDTFVAALYFPGATLLVVSAQYAAPSLLATKLTDREYRDIYIDLSSASVAGTKTFVMDQGADGLSAKPDESQGADSWEQGNKTMTFDGDWRAAKLSQQEYTQAFAAADERYARLLTLLADYAEQHRP